MEDNRILKTNQKHR